MPALVPYFFERYWWVQKMTAALKPLKKMASRVSAPLLSGRS